MPTCKTFLDVFNGFGINSDGMEIDFDFVETFEVDLCVEEIGLRIYMKDIPSILSEYQSEKFEEEFKAHKQIDLAGISEDGITLEPAAYEPDGNDSYNCTWAEKVFIPWANICGLQVLKQQDLRYYVEAWYVKDKRGEREEKERKAHERNKKRPFPYMRPEAATAFQNLKAMAPEAFGPYLDEALARFAKDNGLTDQ